MILLGHLVYAKNQQEQDIIFDAHVHGLSEITMMIEEGVLAIQLTSPTVNLIGFEYK